MKKVLVTGSSGFVGRLFCSGHQDRYQLTTVSLQNVAVEDLKLSDVDVILHLAGIAHRMEKTDDRLYFDVNFELTKKLAQASKKAGVKQFIFMSTIKVYGEHSQWLTPETLCTPNDAYGKSKFMAEEYLRELSSSQFNVAIIRPPLIYGPGVKGNMDRLIQLVSHRKFIPLGNIENKRSMVSIDNLIQLINLIIEKEAKGLFLVQDRKPISTSDLLKELIKAKQTNAKLISIPYGVRFLIRKFLPHIYKRLFGSLVVDDSSTKNGLNYEPLQSTSEGIKKMIKGV